QAGDTTSDLQVTGVNLNGGTSPDAAGFALISPGQGGLSLQIDTGRPQDQSLIATDPLLTNANVVHYTLTFSEPVTGVKADAFNLVTTGVAGANIVSVDPVSGSNGTQYTLTVHTGTGDGTVALVLSGAGVHDLAENSLPGGVFQPQTTYETGFSPNAVVIADVNGDGKPDLVTATAGSNAVSVLLGNGDGTFQGQISYAAGFADFSVAVGDLNGDGK